MNLVHKSFTFFSNNLNKVKYDELYTKAIQLRDFKNEISLMVCDNFNYFINLSKFEWINYFRTTLPNCNNQDISNAISDVYVTYDNKRSKIITSSVIKIQKSYKITKYKKKVGNHEVGDTKSSELIKRSTDLTKVVSFLSRYWNDGLVEYIDNVKDDDNSKKQLRYDVLFYIEKYGGRIINLVRSRNNRLINQLSENPIEFVSLSFNSCTEQKQNIIIKNPNKNNESNALIILPGQKINKGKLIIPVKFSNSYHGEIKHYFKTPSNKGIRQINYLITFDEKNKRIKITLTRLKHDDVVKGKYDIYGIDINVKTNLFSDKYGFRLDYDRKQLLNYVEFLKKIDNKLKVKRIVNENPVLNKKDRLTFDKLTSNMKDMIKRKSNEIVKHTIELGKNHIVLEDLRPMDKMFVTNEEFEGFKYSRLIRILGLANIKNIIRSIANKKGLQVTFVQPHYTSQTCKCGCIDKRNRPKQEIFKCISCGEIHDADTHSPEMIEDRLRLDVLREGLLSYDKGLFTPKKLNKNTIKSILEECYDINKVIPCCNNKFR